MTDTGKGFLSSLAFSEDIVLQEQNGPEVVLEEGTEPNTFRGTVPYKYFDLDTIVVLGNVDEIPVVIARGFIPSDKTTLSYHTENRLFEFVNNLVDSDSRLLEVYALNSHLVVEAFIPIERNSIHNAVSTCVSDLITFVHEAENFLDAAADTRVNPSALLEAFLIHVGNKPLDQNLKEFFSQVVHTAEALTDLHFYRSSSCQPPITRSAQERLIAEAELLMTDNTKKGRNND